MAGEQQRIFEVVENRFADVGVPVRRNVRSAQT
jgi:hypothetical protein